MISRNTEERAVIIPGETSCLIRPHKDLLRENFSGRAEPCSEPPPPQHENSYGAVKPLSAARFARYLKRELLRGASVSWADGFRTKIPERSAPEFLSISSYRFDKSVEKENWFFPHFFA